MSAGIVFYIGAALVFLLAACNTTEDVTGPEADTATPSPTPTAITTSVGLVTDTLVDPVAVEPRTTENGSMPAVVDVQIDAVDIVAAREEVLARIYEDSLPSVVFVRVVHRLDPDDRQFGGDFFGGIPRDRFDEYQHGAGSGFVWDEEGHILTNWHVMEGSDSVSVVFADGEEFEAELLGGDPDSDLAILKIDTAQRQVKPLPRGDIDDLRVGQLALAIGSPFGQDFTLTSGIVSALGRTIRSRSGPYSIPLVVQTDAPINPGNSGGPLLDRLGQVIGINTQILSQSGANSGVGFAVPIDIAKQVVPDLIEHGKYEYAWLGISGATLTADVVEHMGLPEASRGVLIVKAIEDGPAEGAGIKGGEEEVTIEGEDIVLGGDVIMAINGEPVKEMHDLISYLVEHARPGDDIELDVLHSNGETETITVTLGIRPEN